MQWRVLEGVPEEDLHHLLSVARRRTFARNEVVFHRGDPAEALHLISSGRFAVRIMTPLGHTATPAILGPGGAFGGRRPDPGGEAPARDQVGRLRLIPPRADDLLSVQ